MAIAIKLPPMSQSRIPQRSHDSTTLGRFQLAKFSYAITSKANKGPFSWSHVYGDNELVGAFRRDVSSSPERILFKITRNDSTLEEINLTELAKELEIQLQDNANASTVSLVVRRPCLAVKYPLSSDRAYRFQIMFSSDRDYSAALSILGEMNCLFFEMNSTPTRQSSRLGSSHLSSRNGLSSSSDNFTSSIGMARPIVSNHRRSTISDRSLASSSASSATLAGNSRGVDTLDSKDEPHVATPTSPVVTGKTKPLLNESKERPFRPLTGIAHRDVEDLDLPPKRSLPWEGRAPKKARKTEEPARAIPSEALRTGIRGPKSSSRATKFQGEPPRRQATPSAPSTPIKEHTARAITTSAGTQTTIEPLNASDSTTTALAKFLSYPPGERDAKLEETFCGLLNDDAFMQLCIAVEGAWTRFAVGK
ncbi:hypothetical protein BJY00DRAFT_307228 [Aspergillus carlsbadensis]|nr:hypothetical protein BJY00DRAFT_307228 [Aspergillus carlsbadensis]